MIAVLYAHSDLSGLSLLEEAHYRSGRTAGRIFFPLSVNPEEAGFKTQPGARTGRFSRPWRC